MKKTFLAGAATGIATLALAVPTLAQFAFAAETTTTSPVSSVGSPMEFSKRGRPAPTQAQVQDMVAKETAFLKNIDAFTAVVKSAKQAHLTAITAAALITDDTARQAAIEKANQDERAAIEAAITANPDLKGMMPFGKGPGFGGMMKGGKGGMHGKFGFGMMKGQNQNQDQ